MINTILCVLGTVGMLVFLISAASSLLRLSISIDGHASCKSKIKWYTLLVGIIAYDSSLKKKIKWCFVFNTKCYKEIEIKGWFPVHDDPNAGYAKCHLVFKKFGSGIHCKQTFNLAECRPRVVHAHCKNLFIRNFVADETFYSGEGSLLTTDTSVNFIEPGNTYAICNSRGEKAIGPCMRRGIAAIRSSKSCATTNFQCGVLKIYKDHNCEARFLRSGEPVVLLHKVTLY